MTPYTFGTPAFIDDFPDAPDLAQQLQALWSTRIEGFTQQAIAGNPYNVTHASGQTYYYDPTSTPIPAGTAAVEIVWTAFPNRLEQYLAANQYPKNPYDRTDAQILGIGDTGEGLEQIPTKLCPAADWKSPLHEYGPYGPRGWLDEYCEWSVTRDDADRIVRVDFVCENPEYWYTLWSVSPERAAEIYEATLNAGAPEANQITVTVDDLTLKDADGNAVIDPSTGGPAYNPLNKWNSGPISVRGTAEATGGAMHLTSTPNTLQTEMGLAGAATVQRAGGNSDPQALICCAQYGQNYRNSDPHIGQGVNQVVGQGLRVSLADPVGLYIQPPSTATWSLPPDDKLPAGAQASDCWQVLRGQTTLEDPVTGKPFPKDNGGGFILHAAFQLPQAWIDAGVSFTAGDVMIGGIPIKFAGQIARTFQVGLYARPLHADKPQAQPCVGTPDAPTPQPLQLFHASLWEAYYGTPVSTPMGVEMSLASSTVIVPPHVEAGSTGVKLALTYAGTEPAAPAIAFTGAGEGTVASAVSDPVDVTYAVPGNSYPGPVQMVTFDLDVDAGAAPGIYPITLTTSGGASGGPEPAFLQIVPSGSIPS